MKWILMALVLAVLVPVASAQVVLSPLQLTRLVYSEALELDTTRTDLASEQLNIDTLQTTVASEALLSDTLRIDLDAEALEIDTLQTQVGALYLVAAGFATMTNDTMEVAIAAADSADGVIATYTTAGGTLLLGASVLVDDTLTLYGDSAAVIQYLVVR